MPNKPVLTVRDAILEVRKDVKELVRFKDVQEAADLPRRVADLERFRWIIVGAALAAGAGGGSLMGVLITAVGKANGSN